jgi:hypothetical protein
MLLLWFVYAFDSDSRVRYVPLVPNRRLHQYYLWQLTSLRSVDCEQLTSLRSVDLRFLGNNAFVRFPIITCYVLHLAPAIVSDTGSTKTFIIFFGADLRFPYLSTAIQIQQQFFFEPIYWCAFHPLQPFLFPGLLNAAS